MTARPGPLALIGVAFGTVAAGTCAEVLDRGPFPGSPPDQVACLVSGMLAGSALLLLGFRLPRVRRAAWPSIALGAAGLLAVGIGRRIRTPETLS